MLNSYDDIRSRISEPPLWWDEEGVPRYCVFTPNETADIYAHEAALVEIACQSCGRTFRVCFSYSSGDRVTAHMMNRPDPGEHALAEDIRMNSIHYGDPPNDGCCPCGPTMNCEDLRVLEYWRKNKDFDWERDASLEIVLPVTA